MCDISDSNAVLISNCVIRPTGSGPGEAWWSFLECSEINVCGKIVSDFEHVISHHIQHDDFMAALGVLIKQVRTMLILRRNFLSRKIKGAHFITKILKPVGIVECISLGEERRPFSLLAQVSPHIRHCRNNNKTGPLGGVTGAKIT